MTDRDPNAGMQLDLPHGDDHSHLMLAFDIEVYRKVLGDLFPEQDFSKGEPQEWLARLTKRELNLAMKALRRYANEHMEVLTNQDGASIGVSKTLSKDQMREGVAEMVRAMLPPDRQPQGSLLPKRRKNKGMRAVTAGHSNERQELARKAYQKKRAKFFED